jgi:hypothetical protein
MADLTGAVALVIFPTVAGAGAPTAVAAVALLTRVDFVAFAPGDAAPFLVAAGFAAAGLVPAGRVGADRVAADRVAGFVDTDASAFAGATFTAAAVLLARLAFAGCGCSGAGPTAAFARLARLAGTTATAGDTGSAAVTCTGAFVALAFAVFVVLDVAELDGVESDAAAPALARVAFAGFAAPDGAGAAALSFDDVFTSGFAVAALVTAFDLGPPDFFGAVPRPSPLETAVTRAPAFSLVVALCAGMAWFVAFGIDPARSAMASPQTKRARGLTPRTAR